jgi:hypothetical protein
VEGSETSYNWSITDAVPETSGATVAQFSGGVATATGNLVMVQGLAKGTFKLVADPDAISGNGNELPSGMITVGQNSTTANISLAAGWNLISIPNQPTDTSVTSVLASIGGQYTSVWTYNTAADTWYKYYTPATGLDFLNDLTEIIPGKGYWVEITGNPTLTVTAPPAPSSTVPLKPGWNLVGLKKDAGVPITTAMVSVSGNYTSIWRYDTSTDTWYKYYTPATGLDFLNDMSDLEIEKGYWIEVSTECDWVP